MDYTAIKNNLVIPKIREFGKVVVLRRPGSNSGYTKGFDPVEGRHYWTLIAPPNTVVYTDPASSPVDVSGYGVEVKYEQNEIDGTTIKAGDRRFKVADLPLPTTSDKLVVDSVILNIISTQPVQPGAVTLLWTLQCRA